MNEHKIIESLKRIADHPSSLKLEDDVFFDKNNSLIASIDTYNEKVHYLNFKKPELIIKKVIRSSISDIISKGVSPKYLLISFSGTKSNFSNKNIKKIVNSINQEKKKFKFSLIGGDTSKSKKSSFTICVFSYTKKIISRKRCLNKDDIYVTGNIGDPFVGLCILKNKIKTSSNLKNYFVDKYFKPKLAYGIHKELFKFASSSMDVSDGLLIDLKKMIRNNKQGFVIDINRLPLSNNLMKLIKKKTLLLKNCVFNGDDYQILFTSKKKYRKRILNYSKKWNQKITRIGYITVGGGNFVKINGNLKKITDYQGYIHNFN